MFTIGNIVLGEEGNFSKSVRKPTSKGECPKTFAADCSEPRSITCVTSFKAHLKGPLTYFLGWVAKDVMVK